MHDTIERSPCMLNAHIAYGHNGNNYRPPNMAWYPEPHDVAVIAKMKRTISSLRIVPPNFSYGNRWFKPRDLRALGALGADNIYLNDQARATHKKVNTHLPP